MEIKPLTATLLVASGLLMGCPNNTIQVPDGGPCDYSVMKGVFYLSQYFMEEDTVVGLRFTQIIDTNIADTATTIDLDASEFCGSTRYRYCEKAAFDSLMNAKTQVYIEKMRLMSGSCNPDIPAEVSLTRRKTE